MVYSFHPIGLIHSPNTDKRSTPIQPSRSLAIGKVEIFPEYTQGLEGVEGFSHLILLYVFHSSEGYSLSVKPFLDNQQHGLFATRHPCRPNPLGISIVRLLKRNDNWLVIEGVDVLDQTPLLDLKPYVPDFDSYPGARAGWYEQRSER